MVDLIAKPATDEMLPLSVGAVSLRACPDRQILSVAPYQGQEKSVSEALTRALGVGLPEAGGSVAGDSGEVVWSGRGQYLVFGGSIGPVKAAVTDQTDAWVCVSLDGALAVDVLARLCPLNLGQMATGDVARSLLGHMQAVIIRREDGFDLMVFRSMAGTLVHELHAAMKSVAAQSGL